MKMKVQIIRLQILKNYKKKKFQTIIEKSASKISLTLS